MSLRYFLPIYLLAYIIAAFFWRSYEVWKKTGVNPVVFKGSDSAHDFVGRVFKALFAVIVVVDCSDPAAVGRQTPRTYRVTKALSRFQQSFRLPRISQNLRFESAWAGKPFSRLQSQVHSTSRTPDLVHPGQSVSPGS
jgi:hypothetical protein